MKGLPEGPTMLLSHILPNSKAWPGGCAGDFDLAPIQGLVLIMLACLMMTQFLVPKSLKKRGEKVIQ
jgi:hypothetical protein